MAEGWIKLHRSFLEHWLCDEYRPLTKREAWETMLFTVNYESKKCLIKGQLYDCDRGQSLLSLQNWADKFVWSVQNVRSFFKLLESDNMIITEGLQYTTRLTICNYDKYQDKQQTANTPPTDQQQAANTPPTTTKELKELEEIKENNIIHYDEIVNLFNSICISLSKVSKCTESRKIKIKSRFNEIGGIEKIKELFLMVQSSSFLKGENKENWKATFDWLFENDKNWVKVMEGNYNKTQQNNSSLRRIDKYEAFGMKRND